MKSRNTKILAAAASAVAVGGLAHSAQAAVVTSVTRTPSVVFSNGTYDVIDVTVTGLTGLDATPGSGGPGIVLDPELLGLSGTFTASGTAMFATPGAATGTYVGGKYDNATGAPQVSGTPANYGASYVDFPSTTNTDVRTGLTNGTGSKTAIQGTSTAFADSWYVTPTTSATGPAGGVEPGQDPNATGINGLLAEILVTPGAGFTFVGSYSDYGYTAGNAMTFTVAPTGTTGGGTGTGTHNIVSLTNTTPTGYGSSVAALTVNRIGPNSYQAATAAASPASTMGYFTVAGFSSTDTGPEVFALKLSSASSDATIIAAINAQQGSGLTASAVTGAYASLFPGYDILLTETTPPPLSGTSDVAFDLSSVAPGISVVDVAAVPEPATAVGLLVGAGSLLLGRRKNRAA